MEEEIIQNTIESTENTIEETMTIAEQAQNGLDVLQSTEFVDFITQFDVLFVLVLLLGSAFYFYTVGKDHPIICLIAAYVAYVSVTLIPWVANFSPSIGQPDYVVRAGIFLAILAIIGLLMARNEYFEPYHPPQDWHLAAYTIIFAGLTVAFVARIVPPEILSETSELTQTLFLSEPWSSLWFVYPIAALLLIKGK